MTSVTQNRLTESFKYYAIGLWNGLDEDHCFIFASGIAFNALLCIIPLSLIIFQIFSVIMQNDAEAQHAVIHFIKTSLPIEQYGPFVQDWVQNQFSYVSNASLIPGIIALVVLVWLASALFSSLRSAVNGIYHIKTRRNIAFLKLKDIWSIFVVAFFLLITFLIHPFVGALRKISLDILPDSLSSIIHSTITTVVSIVLMTFVFYYLYKSLPHQRIPWRAAGISTIVTVILIELMKFVFTFYLERISSLGAVYGAYAFVAVVALWAYYVALVFTIGAVVGKLFYARIKQN
ncbi:MAG TPA: YihY/virulence factor BrkB family protein [Candidatus Kapabacteria bacterium]|nr:YihY/virulence factor BrkB family protein [Candidatus Kapabacteria bacterium]